MFNIKTVSIHYKEWLYKVKYLRRLVFRYYNINLFLNQERASHRLTCAWFLKIVSVHECLYAYVCVCVSTPKATIN